MPKEKDDKPTDEFETVNAASALWTKPKSEISDEDYQSFYKSLGHDFNDALAWTHNRVEGSQSFTTLLYLPSQPPFDLMMGGRDERKGLKLYIKRGFIMDAAEELLPNYLRFERGVVDADDLPLNVSREILQHNRQLERIKGACVKRVLDLIEKLAKTNRRSLRPSTRPSATRSRRASSRTPTTASASPGCCATPRPRARAPARRSASTTTSGA